MKSFLFIVWAGLSVCTQAVHAAPLGESGLADEARTEDFVHDVSVFDACYPVFRKIYGRFAYYEKQYDGAYYSHLPPDYPSRSEYEPTVRVEREKCLRYARKLAEVRDSLYARPGFSLPEEKRQLVRQLSVYRDTATVLPSVYQVIDASYGGDVTDYVDDLFAHSVMTNTRLMRRFKRHPSTRRMQRDMGFQFVVSKLMYRAWEAQGRP